MGQKFLPVVGSQYSRKDANVIGPQLLKLAKQGKSSAASIVEEAEKKKSPLHPYFTWDDSQAAHLYRLTEARKMARSILIVVKISGKEPEKMRAFHCVQVTSVDNGKTRTGQYLTIEQVTREQNYADQVINRALAELQGWRQRYSTYTKVFGGVFTAIDKVVAKQAKQAAKTAKKPKKAAKSKKKTQEVKKKPKRKRA